MQTLVFMLLCIAMIPAFTGALGAAERFEYSLYWNGIKAGNASLEKRESGDTVQLISTVTSTPLAGVVYTVDDLVVSTLKKGPGSAGMGLPSAYRIKLREGRHRRDKEYRFDYAGKKILYINHLEQEKTEFPLAVPTLDPLACIYYVRTAPLAVGKPLHVIIFDNKRSYRMEVRVLRREEVDTPVGRFKTIAIQPVLQSEGFFSRRGELFLWLTDDDRRIPVQIETKINVGTVIGRLSGGTY
ncbi:MAG TPA: DUF3108 domain-containing protein [Dissulfurispiraceae bacterium]|nr:DUF3108 domain-containing protein [Dissulfurispiraceae bacterium]